MICQYDQTEHSTLDDLLAHLKRCKITQKIYFEEFAPQRDLLTAEIIPFKSPVSRYLKQSFAHKNNLKKYLKEYPEEGKKWAINWLKDRRIEKGLIYPPSQTELRSLMCPTAIYYDHIEGYNAICKNLGYQIRYTEKWLANAIPTPHWIIVDTREQHPLSLDAPHRPGTLRIGDYGLDDPYNKGIYIERKSLEDLVGTISERKIENGDSHLARFTRELERAAEIGAYIIMLVECNINDALGFNHLPKDKCPPFVRYCKINPDHVFKNLRDLLTKFPLNFQVLFVSGRNEAKKAVPLILGAGEIVRKIDLQLAYEKRELVLA